MKSDTVMMLAKLAVYTIVGGLVPMGTALQQWINSGEWPPDINWVGMWIGFGIGAGNNFLSFTSSAWTNWKTARTNGNTPNETTPKP